MKYILLTLAFFVFSVSTVLPQTKGTITGTVKDKKTGEGLPSVNLKIKGTYYGAASDVFGNFKIQNISAGTYQLDVTLLGYKNIQITGVIVSEGKNTPLDIKMEETSLTLDQEVVIVGEKPLFNIEETSSRRATTSEDIQVAAIQKVQDVVALQVGVTQTDNEIHIRGGRTYENAYLLNGISVQDPLAGSGFGLQLSPDVIEEVEVLTGGYNAEFGQATSGVVNVKTKEGKDKFSGGVNYRSDNFGFNTDARSYFNSDIFSANLSGPLFAGITFFASADANVTDGYTRWAEDIEHGKPIGYFVSAPHKLTSTIFHGSQFAPRRENRLSWLGKFTYRPTPTEKIQYSASQSITINQDTKTIQATLERADPNPGFQFRFLNIPDSAATFTSVNTFNTLSFTNTVSTQTFYELQVSFYNAHVRGDNNGVDKNGDGVVNWNDYAEPQDIVTFPIDTFRVNPETLRVIPGDGFYDVGSPPTWRDHVLDEFTFKGDLTHHLSETNKFKSGIEMKFQNIQYVDIFDPWIKPLGIDNDKYKVSPAMGAMFTQNSVTISGMILNFGLRMDYWFPGKYVDDAAKSTEKSLVADVLRSKYLDETYTLFGRRWKARLSPRLGISHPISDNQTLFFSYGHFSKLPRPQFVYSKLVGSSAQSSNQTIGNPNLNPETTVAYELGMRYQITDNDVLSVTTYYKDIFDYITSIDVPIRGPRSKGTYKTYVNQDYARTRGIEAEYKKRIGKWFRTTLSGSYSIATGKSSSANEGLLGTEEGRRENVTENHLVWDRPLQVTASLNFTVPKKSPLFGMDGILEDINAYTKIFFQSGKRYSPWVFAGIDSINYFPARKIYRDEPKNYNTGLGDYWFYLDMNIEKYIDASFGTIVLSFEIQNMLNNKNSQIINPVTGNAYEYGDDVPLSDSWNDPRWPDLTKPISVFPYNPSRYLNPRTFRFGVSLRF